MSFMNIISDYNYNVISYYDSRDSSGEIGWAGALNNGLDADSKELGVNVTLDKFESRRVQVLKHNILYKIFVT